MPEMRIDQSYPFPICDSPTRGVSRRVETPDLGDRPHKRHDRFFSFVVLAIYAGVVFFVSLHHEPWRDEADAWLAARDLSPSQLFSWLGAAGTPGLWYIVLMPAAKVGLPYVTMQLIHATLAVATAAVILCFAPFPRYFRCLLVFSYYFAYQNAVVARSYVLTDLLLLAAAATMSGRRPRPVASGILVGLLANCNVHGFFIAGALLLARTIAAFRRREYSRRLMAGGLLACLGLVLAFAQLLPPANGQRMEHGPNWRAAVEAINLAYLPRVPAEPWLPRILGVHPVLSNTIFSIREGVIAVILISTFLAARRHPYACYFLAISLSALLYIFVWKFFASEIHAGLILLVSIFTLWVVKADEMDPSAHAGRRQRPPVVRLAQMAWGLTLGVACVEAFIWAARDVRFPYSTAPRMAAFLNSSAAPALPIAAFPDSFAASVLPYMSRTTRFWLVGREEFGSYMLWDRDWVKNSGLSQDEVLRRVDRAFPDRKCLLLVAHMPLHNPEEAGLKMIFQSGGTTG